jgi:hypothetical protein
MSRKRACCHVYKKGSDTVGEPQALRFQGSVSQASSVESYSWDVCYGIILSPLLAMPARNPCEEVHHVVTSSAP